MIIETLDIIASKTPKWMRWALCADADPDLFFPERGEVNSGKVQSAIKICNHCPVKARCLRWALQTGDKYAILGGKTPQQRTYIRRQITRMRRKHAPSV